LALGYIDSSVDQSNEEAQKRRLEMEDLHSPLEEYEESDEMTDKDIG
jgi:hypothetical protein